VRRIPIPVERSVPTGTTNAYLLGSDRALLVDPPARHPDLDALVEERSLAHLVVTHTHPDHVGGVAAYAATTDATVWARRGRTAEFEAATGVAPDGTLTEGSQLETDAGTVTVLDTPGHARDHLSVAVRAGDEDVVCCGDLAVGEGSVVVGAPEGDMRAYLTSLRRLRARAPDRLLPGHGPPVDDPRATIDRLIDHRLARERRVERAVAGGARSLEAIVDAAYDKNLTGVRDLAAATVRAHLEKLAVEGRVAWDAAADRATPATGGGFDANAGAGPGTGSDDV
jgi:glyoxylase-like metal-dependent hydrolase (beta-lactamase superfamily II)